MGTKHSARLTIFEGPDGAGKTTTAKTFAETTGARYVHFSALPRVGDSLGRIYVEAMLPALLGYQDVVFDRCWLSEVPYGYAFRGGRDRLGPWSRRMLERLAMRCATAVVRCNPGWDLVAENFSRRKHVEMLEDLTQLRTVYDLYNEQKTALPTVFFDYTVAHGCLSHEAVENARTISHPLGLGTAGNWLAKIVLIGDTYAELKNQDAFYQWPFASFNQGGCSQWLAWYLDQQGIGEDQVLWANADQDLDFLRFAPPGTKIIALGSAARQRLEAMKLPAMAAPHPQSHKRFNHHEHYMLGSLIKGTSHV